jgi:hypothetical protein
MFLMSGIQPESTLVVYYGYFYATNLASECVLDARIVMEQDLQTAAWPDKSVNTSYKLGCCTLDSPC